MAEERLDLKIFKGHAMDQKFGAPCSELRSHRTRLSLKYAYFYAEPFLSRRSGEYAIRNIITFKTAIFGRF